MLKKIFNADAIFGYIMIAISLWFYYFSVVSFGVSTVDSGIGEGYFPKILSVAIILLALFIIFDSIVKDKHYFIADEEQKQGVRMMLKINALLVLYVAVWPYIHFIIQTLALLMAMCYILKMGKKFTFIFSTVFSLCIYFLFANVFHILL